MSSLSTLRDYSDRRNVLSFMLTTLSRTRKMGVTVVVMAPRGIHKGTLSSLIPSYDIVLDSAGASIDKVLEDVFFR